MPRKIGMVITIGTPNTGTPLAGIGSVFNSPLFCGTSQFRLAWTGTSWCQDHAIAGMSSFGGQIAALPELPSAIPLHAIAGDASVLLPLLGVWQFVDTQSDGLVPVSSALHLRGGGGQQTTDTFPCHALPGVPMISGPCAHAELPGNPEVIWKVHNYIRAYLQANPLSAQPSPGTGDHCLIYQPEDQQATCQPSIVTGFWMTGQGQWTVHGGNLRISPGAPAGTIAQTMHGTETWNAGGQLIIGHARLTLVTQPDGSLAGTYAGDAWYTQTGPLPAGFQVPSPPEMLAGQTITLVPVAPGLAKTTYNSDSVPPWPASYAGGNPYWCGAALAVANPSQYCGA